MAPAAAIVNSSKKVMSPDAIGFNLGNMNPRKENWFKVCISGSKLRLNRGGSRALRDEAFRMNAVGCGVVFPGPVFQLCVQGLAGGEAV
jgi:hypothetical protein